MTLEAGMAQNFTLKLKDCKEELEIDGRDTIDLTQCGLLGKKAKQNCKVRRKYVLLSDSDSESSNEDFEIRKNNIKPRKRNQFKTRGSVEDSQNRKNYRESSESKSDSELNSAKIIGDQLTRKRKLKKNGTDTESDEIGRQNPKMSARMGALLRRGIEDNVSDVDTSRSQSASSDDGREVPRTLRSKKKVYPALKKIRRKKETDSEDSAGSSASEEKQDRKINPGKKKRARRARNTGRKRIKKIISEKELEQHTKEAAKQEQERLRRLEERHQNDKTQLEEDIKLSAVVLQKNPLVQVSPYIANFLRPHQIEGIRFIWDNLVESSERAKTEPGAGCILAHCMGLGKTLQTISCIHTFLKNRHLPFKCVLVVAPMNTVRNWVAEFVQWCEDGDELKLYTIAEARTNKERIVMMRNWKMDGGVLITGYEMYRIMATKIKYKSWRDSVKECLIDPGPDIIVCDEGHMLKNSGSHISKELSKIKTKRRLVLTGTPLQNNLVEYHCMVNFVKPGLIGSLNEFRNRFVNPILNGQHMDSTQADVNIMKKRSHVLHQMLSGFVQRKDYSVLKPYLSSKFEYVLKVRLTPLQIKLYQHYLDTKTNRGTDSSVVNSSGKGASLFTDYQNLMRVWTHPKSLLLHSIKREKLLERQAINNFLTDEESEECTGSETDEWSAATSSEEDAAVNNHNTEVKTSTKKGAKNRRTRGKSAKKVANIKGCSVTLNSVNNSKVSASSLVESDSSDGDITFRNKKKSKRRSRIKYSSDEYKGDSSEKDEANDEEDTESDEHLPDRRTRLRRKNGNGRRLRGEEASSEEEEEALGQKESTSNDWYTSLLPEDKTTLEDFHNSSKITILFEILRLAEEQQEKVLVFSQSLVSLDLIEMMLASFYKNNDDSLSRFDVATMHTYKSWHRNVDYFRMDGSTLGQHRQRWINAFNNEDDKRSRLFLISTRAGSLGVNLVGANRVIIFDTSWNPSHDTQSMFRVYRFGQTKKCYIYRLIAEGTMEEKIYQRQVNKQSLAFRVVDEQQINRYFTASSLAEMYSFNPTTPEIDKGKPMPAVPKDKVLSEILSDPRLRHLVASFHEHDSLLDHQVEQELTEEERKVAWEEYEMEKKQGFAPVISREMKPINSWSDPASCAGHFGFNLRDSMAMMTRVNKLMQDAFIKVKSYEPKPVSSIIAQLRTTPLYANTPEDTLEAIATEVNYKLMCKKNEAQVQFQTLQVYFRQLQQLYFENVNDMIGGDTNCLNSRTGNSSGVRIPSRDMLLQQMTSTTGMLQNGNPWPQQSTTNIEVISISDDEEKQSTSGT